MCRNDDSCRIAEKDQRSRRIYTTSHCYKDWQRFVWTAQVHLFVSLKIYIYDSLLLILKQIVLVYPACALIGSADTMPQSIPRHIHLDTKCDVACRLSALRSESCCLYILHSDLNSVYRYDYLFKISDYSSVESSG